MIQTIKKQLQTTKKWFFAASMKKKAIVIVLLLVVLVGGYLIFSPKQPKAQYQTAQVTRDTIISSISESGTVTSDAQTNVASTTDGVVTEIYVKNGDLVVAGQNLFKVKSTATPQEKASAYASYQSALNSLTSAKENKQSLDAQMWTKQQAVLDAQNTQDYKNANTTNPSTKKDYTDLEKQSIDSALVQAHKDFSAAEQKYKDADMAVSAAQAQVTSAWLGYQATQDSIVTAPINGTVANFSAQVGSGVASGTTKNTNGSSTSTSTSTNSTPVLVIANLDNLNVTVQASEVDVPKIKEGQKVTITLDAFPDQTFVGTVASIDTIGTSSSGVVTYNIYISFVSPPSNIFAGMTATAVIQTERKDNVLIVPSTAVQTANGQSYVRVLKNGQLTQVPVETGITSDSDTEIISGLTEGQTIVTSVTTPTTRAASGATSSPFGTTNRGFGGGFGGGGGAVRVGR